MDRNYDIDSILAEIKQKKAGKAAAEAAASHGRTAEADPYDRPHTAYREPPRRTADYDDFDYERPARPLPTKEYQAYEDDDDFGRPVLHRPIRPVRDYDDDYFSRPVPPRRRAGEPQQATVRLPRDYDIYDEPPRNRAYRSYEREQAHYDPVDAVYSAAQEADRYNRRAEEDGGRKSLSIRRPSARRQDEPDEFIMKYSGLSPIGTGARRRPEWSEIRNNFGAPVNSPERRQAEARQKAAPREEPPAAPAEPAPEPKHGFQFHAEAETAEEPVPQMAPEPVRKEKPAFDAADFGITEDAPAGAAPPLPFHVVENGPEQELTAEDDSGDYEDEPASRMGMEEFNSTEETSSVKADLNTLRGGLMMRFTATILCSLGLLYLGFTESLPLPLPDAVSATGAPAVFVILNLVLLMIAALFCHNTISEGVAGLFRLRANNDSLASLAVLASVMQGVSLLLHPAALADNDIHLYFAVASLGLLFNTIGKMFTVGRITGNFRFVTSNTPKYTAQNLEQRDLCRDFTWDMNIDEPHIAYSAPTGFVENFVEQSYADDTSDNIAKITVPIIFVGSVVVAVLSYVFNENIFVALSTFAAVLAISSPITATIVASLPQHKAYRVLTKEGAALSGYNAVERFAETNVVLADACDLFTSDEVLLHNIKTFEKNRIDEAILDAASVLCVCNGAVKNIFLRIIQGNTKMLKPVENLVYEDAMGVSAWVGGKRVLIGNSDLMRFHGIDTPSKDYEAKYRTEDRDILYLANSGELTAMFVISYVRNDDVDYVLGELEHKGISIVVRSVDPNLTAAKIARIYDLPEEMIRILPAKLHTDFEKLARPRANSKGYIVHNGSFAGFAHAVSAASSVKVAVNIGLIVQIVGMILGYTLVTFFSFMGSMAQTTMPTVLIYQLVWGIAVWLFSLLRRI